MKVYELIHELSKLPAGYEVTAYGAGIDEAKPIMRLEMHGDIETVNIVLED